MANHCKVTMIGRLVGEVEYRAFQTGNAVYNFRFVVNGRRKDASGNWIDTSMFIDVSVFSHGDRKSAELVRDSCRKGTNLFVEGRLELDEWEDKNGGGKRSKHKVICDNFQFLDPKGSGGASTGGGYEPQQGGYRPPQQQTAPGTVVMDQDNNDIPY